MFLDGWSSHHGRARGRGGIAGVILVVVATLMTGCGPGIQSWTEGTDHGAWHLVFTGHGAASAADDGTVAIAPQPPTGADTHAALVVSTVAYSNLNTTVRLRTTAQLRRPQPNPWEVAWVLWHYTDPEHFYYVALKPFQWEIGKENPAYPGNQRFLATGPGVFPVGQWHEVRIRQTATTFTVWANGIELATITDTEDPYLKGAIGFYSEDANAEFQAQRACCIP